jgi:sorting nexin-9/18/33
MSKAERLLSFSLLSLITGKPVASAPSDRIGEEEEEEKEEEEEEDSLSSGSGKDTGVNNSDGAWCWREGCTGALKIL